MQATRQGNSRGVTQAGKANLNFSSPIPSTVLRKFGGFVLLVLLLHVVFVSGRYFLLEERIKSHMPASSGIPCVIE